MATDVSDFVIPRFHPVLGDVMAHGNTHYWLPGGCGSTKSSFISIAIVLLVIANPKANAVVVRFEELDQFEGKQRLRLRDGGPHVHVVDRCDEHNRIEAMRWVVILEGRSSNVALPPSALSRTLHMQEASTSGPTRRLSPSSRNMSSELSPHPTSSTDRHGAVLFLTHP